MEQMRMLSTDKALALYEILKPHLPKNKEQELLDFIGDIAKSMGKNNPASYAYCLQLLSGLEVEDLEKMNSAEAFGMFSGGLIENKVVGLVGFCESIGL